MIGWRWMSSPCHQEASMEDVDQVSSLTRDIYDAAVDPALWTGVLRKVRAFVGGSAAALFVRDAARKDLDVYYEDGGLDPQCKQLCFGKYAKLDPFTAGHAFADVEETVSTVDLAPCDGENRAEPLLLVDVICVVLDKSAAGAAMFGIFRRERDGLDVEAVRRRMQLIVPHVRRAVLIGRAMDRKAAEAASFVDALDGLSAGLFLVDATGRIVHANTSGHAMLHERSVLRAASGKLVALESAAATALNAIFAAAGSGGTGLGSKGIAVPLRAHDGSCYVAHVLPRPSGAHRRAGASGAAVATLFVHKAELEAPSPPEAIARFHRLTPSELRVLLAIVQVGGVPETAAALGVAEATVKTHLHRVFGKTGASRQADLVKLVAGFSNPVAGRRKNPAASVRHHPIDGSGAHRLSA
jgi:DNA-binding CsgD family transcriptional regulator